MNLKRYRAVWRLIERFPEQHNQATWHCGTSHCVAGWADLVAAGYKRPERVCVPVYRVTPLTFTKLPTKLREWVDRAWASNLWDTCDRAKSWLKLTSKERDYLFSQHRTHDELRAVAKTGKFPWELPS